MKVLCFHPALAPYRVDFFNLLAARTDFEMAILLENLVNQKLDQRSIRAQAKFRWRMFTRGFEFRGRSFRFGIAKLLREVNPAVVISYEASPVTVALCLMRSIWGKPGWKLWTSMDEAAGTILGRRGVRAWLRDWVLRHVDGVIVPSEASAAAYRGIASRKRRGGELRFAVVPIIHDAEAMRKNAEAVVAAGKAWRRKNVPDGWAKMLVFVGRLAPVKNLGWLVRQAGVWNRACGVGGKKAGLVIVGDGGLRESLKRQIRGARLEDCVLLAGKRQGDELYAIMSVADALVLPSNFEPYGAVAGEALQWGVPCVVRDTCGCRELVTDENGAVYHDEHDFRAAMERALALKRGNESILPVRLDVAVNRLVEELKQ